MIDLNETMLAPAAYARSTNPPRSALRASERAPWRFTCLPMLHL